MSPESGSMLRALAGGVRPVDTPVLTTPAADRDTLDFGRVLSLARSGDLRTGLPVAAPPALRAGIDRVTGERLSAATDQAAAMGIDRALILVGNRAFRVDIGLRTVIDAPPEADRAITGIDGVVRVPASDAPPGSPGVMAESPSGPARVVRNTSLLDTLAGASLGSSTGSGTGSHSGPFADSGPRADPHPG